MDSELTEPPRRAHARQLPELIRGLLAADSDTRDDATEELGRRMRGEDGPRIAGYLKTIGRQAADADGGERIERLLRLQVALDQMSGFRDRAGELRERGRRLGGRLASWERYREEADPATPGGKWLIENLERVEMHIGLLRTRIQDLQTERDQLEEQITRKIGQIEDLPGSLAEK